MSSGKEEADTPADLKSIVQRSDEWLAQLKKRESRVRIVSALVAVILVFIVVGLATLGIVSLVFSENVFLHPDQVYPIAIGSFIAGVISAFPIYYLLKRKHQARLKEVSAIIVEMKSASAQKAEENKGIMENALYLTDKALILLPELMGKRSRDSILFGVAAFIFGDIFTQNLAVAIFAGVIVWIFSRYEFGSTYEKHLSEFEARRKAFEKKKTDFMKNL